MKNLLVTGSSGLVGSEVATYFAKTGWRVFGVDNNGRAAFFGPQGDTRWNQRRLETELPNFIHYEVDVRDRQRVLNLLREVRPNAVVHAAAQPSHDLAARIPFDNFDTNAVGTLNLLEATRLHTPDAAFVLMSTNKVYGDAPNELPLLEKEARWDYARANDYDGIREEMRLDRCKHSLFGASKVAADVLVQEYGRYFSMPTCCLRAGCITGPNHAGVELHGFLSYLIRCNLEERQYTIYGYQGKQVRDNIHALDVTRFIHAFIESPRNAEVYNLGGGRGNSCSIWEAFDMAQTVSGRKMHYEYIDQPREGDHICYISNLSKAQSHYPSWQITRTLPSIFEEIHHGWRSRIH